MAKIDEFVITKSTRTGYWNNPDETAKTMGDGWLYTGEDGYVFILDRKKEVLLCSGFAEKKGGDAF